MKTTLGQALAALVISVVPSHAEVTFLKFADINPGTEIVNTSNVVNGGFEDESSGNGHSPAGWDRRIGDMFYTGAPIPLPESAGNNVARIHMDHADIHPGHYWQSVSGLEPDTEYVLSAYIWNLGKDEEGFRGTVVLDFNDVEGEAQITLPQGMEDSSLGYFASATFDTAETGTEFRLRTFVVHPGATSGWEYPEVGALWDNVAITKASEFVAPSTDSPKFPLSISPGIDGAYDLTWTSREGMRYDVLSTEDLSRNLAEWDLVEGDIPAAGTSTSWAVTPDGLKRFYRVEEFPAPPVTIYSENFDEALAPPDLPTAWETGFYAGDTFESTIWTTGAPTFVGPPNAFSGANCIGTNLAGNYGTGSNTWLRSSVIDLSAVTVATLAFQQWVDMDDYDLGDTGTVRVLDASALPEVSVLEVLETNIQGLGPDDWTEFSADLTAASLGKSVVLEFLFVSDGVSDADSSGWYIDDVIVTKPGT